MVKFKTFDEVVDEILINLHEEDIKIIKEIETKEGMIKFHSTVGRYIRNKYELWDENNPLTNKWFKNPSEHVRDGVDYHPCHPDAVSGDILDKVWELVQ